ncbi:MAG: Response regulator [Myxococcaceae bacterium]|nr:Response regulator [Myxococcaceae bacterium]
MGVTSGRRVSQTEMKAAAGFRAELPGLDLGTLIQLTCARRERMVVRIASYGEEGFLYSAAGRIVHATLGGLVGEEAVLRMLGWHSGDFTICERPFPEAATIQRSTEGLLMLAAERANDSALDEVLTTGPDLPRIAPLAPMLEPEESEPLPTHARQTPAPDHGRGAPGRTSEDAQRASSTLHEARGPGAPGPQVAETGLVQPELTRLSTPVRGARPSLPPSAGMALDRLRVGATPHVPSEPRHSSVPSAPPRDPTRASTLPPPNASWAELPRDDTRASHPALAPASRDRDARPTLLPGVPPTSERARNIPPPPPSQARRSSPTPAQAGSDPALVASVRVDARGTLVSSFGSSDHLAQLVAYVAHLVALIQADFALDTFQGLHAELAGLRVLIFHEAGDLVGVLMEPGSASTELRQRLGV